MGKSVQDIACPFCGLCCDDLELTVSADALDVTANGCARSVQAFGEPLPATDSRDRQPSIQGVTCSLDDAVEHAAGLLDRARSPLFGGLGTDVAGARALLQLADRCGATFDHMNSTALLRNLLVIQDSGWMTTTLTEVRNRADVIVVFGDDLEKYVPRFYERCINPGESMFHRNPLQRQVILIGPEPDSRSRDGTVHTTAIPCALEQLGDVAMVMRAIAKGAPLHATTAAGIPLQQLQDVVTQLQEASYGVIAWAGAGLAFPHAELAVQAFSELGRELNAKTRCSALPLGGSDGDHTFSQVATWQTGYPTRASLATGHPHYDPVQFSATRVLTDQEADLLLWVSAFDTQRLPPVTDVSTILLGRAGMQSGTPAEVFIPVGTPGLDHSGHVYRCDTVATLPLHAWRDAGLPSVQATIQAILNSL